VTPETRALLADLSASLILAGVFLVLVLCTVLAFLLARGLGAARRGAPQRLELATRYALGAARQSRQTALAVIEPQVRVMSAWAGIRAGARALLAGGTKPPEAGEPAASPANEEPPQA
jgi:hypothetical protein